MLTPASSVAVAAPTDCLRVSAVEWAQYRRFRARHTRDALATFVRKQISVARAQARTAYWLFHHV